MKIPCFSAVFALLLAALFLNADNRVLSQELTDAYVQSFAATNLPEYTKSLSGRRQAGDQEGLAELMEEIRDVIHDYQYTRDESGDAIAALYLKVADMEEALYKLSIDFENATTVVAKESVRRKMAPIINQVIPAQMKLDKAELAALKQQASSLQADIARRENLSLTSAMREEMNFWLETEEAPPAADPTVQPAGGTFREWTSTAATRIEAAFVELQNTVVVLKKRDGSMLRVPFDKLSPPDQRWVRSQNTSDPFSPPADPFKPADPFGS